MTVIKQYNPTSHTWDVVLIGRPGDPGMEVGPVPPEQLDTLWADTSDEGSGYLVQMTASHDEAIEGTRDDRTMTPLRVREVLDETGGVAVPTLVATQEYPPSAPVAGFVWTAASLGHSARWSGTAWDPVTPVPATANVCCIIGSAFYWIDSATFTATVMPNLGLSGAVLDGTTNLATLGTDANGKPVLNFDGVDDYAQVPDNALFTIGITEDWTVAVVKSSPSYPGGGTIVGTRSQLNNVGSRGFGIYTTGTSGAHAWRVSDGVTMSEAISPNAPAGPHLVGGTVSRASATRVWAGSGSAVGPAAPVSASIDGPNQFRFGRLGGANASYAAMSLYNVGMWRRVLSDEMLVLDEWVRARLVP